MKQEQNLLKRIIPNLKNNMNQKEEKLLMSKLRSPLHISYIAHILKWDIDKATEIIQELEKNDVVVEYNREVAKGYYVIKNK